MCVDGIATHRRLKKAIAGRAEFDWIVASISLAYRHHDESKLAAFAAPVVSASAGRMRETTDKVIGNPDGL